MSGVFVVQVGHKSVISSMYLSFYHRDVDEADLCHDSDRERNINHI